MSHGPLNDLSHVAWRFLDRPSVRAGGIVLTVLVFSAGAAGIWQIEGERVGFVACIYSTLKFFILEGESAYLSRNQGPLAIGLVSVAAFGGPLLTTAFIAFLVRKIAAALRDLQGVHATGHVVILGCGREGVHWGRYLRGQNRPPIVFVNQNEEGPELGKARAMGATVLIGDMQDEAVRDRAAVGSARIVVVCTGNELANIDTARAIEQQTGPLGPRIFCRVVSQSLLFSMKRSAKKSSSRIRYFNIYDFVARDAIEATLRSAGEAAKGKDPDPVHMIICGFGRFGQAVLHAAGTDASLLARLAAVHIVDLHADVLLDEYKFSAPDADNEILKRASPRQSGILNHDLWAELLREPTGALRLVFICTDNDVTNLVHALAIQRLVSKRRAENIRAIVVMRQLERPKTGETGLLYATMGESTDEQIHRLLADSAR